MSVPEYVPEYVLPESAVDPESGGWQAPGGPWQTPPSNPDPESGLDPASDPDPELDKASPPQDTRPTDNPAQRMTTTFRIGRPHMQTPHPC
jgi:hypothetical protein